MTFPAYTSEDTDPIRRGRDFGRSLDGHIEDTFNSYNALFTQQGADERQLRDWGRQALTSTAAWAPGLADEIIAIADGVGLHPWKLGALNARTEILAILRARGEGECSTAVASPLTIQTWDWRTAMHDAGVLHAYRPSPAHEVRTFTEFGILAKIGVNSAGLGVHFNLLHHVDDGDGIGVPVHLVARRILDEASTLDEAIGIARSASVSASSSITVATATGDACALELSPAGLGLVAPDANGVLIHTNHFVDPALVPGEGHDPESPGTYDRYTLLQKRSDAFKNPDLAHRVEALHSHEPPVCAHPDTSQPSEEQSATLATIALDLAGCCLHVHRGGPCTVTPPTWQIF